MTSPPRPTLLALCAALVTVGCGPVDEAEGEAALEAALAATWTAGANGEADAGGARALPLEDASPHRASMDTSFDLIEGPGRHRMVRLLRTVDRGPAGAFRVVDERAFVDPEVNVEGTDEGREGVYDPASDRFVVRRRWGPWMERETLGGHHRSYLRAAYDGAPDLLGAFGSYLRWVPTGETERLAGVDVRWERAELDLAVAPRPLDADALLALRDHEAHWKAWLAATHRPRAVTGRVAFRQGGPREVVAGELDIQGDARVEGREHRFHAGFRYRVEALPARATFTVAAGERVLSARRPRPWKMIRDVLGDALSEVYQPH